MALLNILETITFKGAPDDGDDVNKLFHIEAVRGDLIDVIDECGNQSDDFKCEVILRDGLSWKPLAVLDRVFIGSVVGDRYERSIEKAERVVYLINKKGAIDLDYWNKL